MQISPFTHFKQSCKGVLILSMQYKKLALISSYSAPYHVSKLQAFFQQTLKISAKKQDVVA